MAIANDSVMFCHETVDASEGIAGYEWVCYT